MERLERCPACRARLAEADVCSRCGSDFSIVRRAQRQAMGLARLAVRELFQGQIQQACAAAEEASHLAGPLLALAVARTIRRRETSQCDVMADTPEIAAIPLSNPALATAVKPQVDLNLSTFIPPAGSSDSFLFRLI